MDTLIDDIKILRDCITTISNAVCENPILKMLAYNVQGKTIPVIVATNDVLPALISNIILKGKPYSYELNLLFKRGMQNKLDDIIMNMGKCERIDLKKIEEEVGIRLEEKRQEIMKYKDLLEKKENECELLEYNIKGLKCLAEKNKELEDIIHKSEFETMTLLKSNKRYNDYLSRESYNVKESNKFIRMMLKDLESFIIKEEEFNITDYANVIGRNFEKLCALMYKLRKDRNSLKGLKNMLEIYLSNHVEERLDKILDIYMEIRENTNILLSKLKDEMSKNGVYCRKVGETTEYYGITNTVYEEREHYKNECNKLNKKIRSLEEKITQIMEDVRGERYKRIFESLKEDNTNSYADMLNYYKRKLYRRKKVANLYGTIEYTPGKRYAGINISKRIFDYLSEKSLVAVLNLPIEKVTTLEQMRYALKCLTKINKIMDVKKALLWTRNFFAQKLKRPTSGRVKKIDQVEQDKRFYNTYLFIDGLTMEEFLETEDKATQYHREYKQLDRETNAHYLDRYYNYSTYKARTDRIRGNMCLTITAHVQKMDLASVIDKGKNTSYKPRRNPLVAYKRIMNLIEKEYKSKLDSFNLKQLKTDLINGIPQLTWGTQEPPESHVLYCRKVINRYVANFDAEDIAFKEIKERTREAKMKEQEYTTTSDTYSDYDDDYEDYYGDDY